LQMLACSGPDRSTCKQFSLPAGNHYAIVAERS
jgi:hypothetical protein